MLFPWARIYISIALYWLVPGQRLESELNNETSVKSKLKEIHTAQYCWNNIKSNNSRKRFDHHCFVLGGTMTEIEEWIKQLNIFVTIKLKVPTIDQYYSNSIKPKNNSVHWNTCHLQMWANTNNITGSHTDWQTWRSDP